MITEQDLREAIAECQGQRNPNASTCIRLAAFLTIQRELFGQDNHTEPQESRYSFAAAPEARIGSYGGTDFLEAIAGKDMREVFLVMDELMDTMQVLQPRIYDSVMRKISNI